MGAETPSKPYPAELRERAVRLVREQEAEHAQASLVLDALEQALHNRRPVGSALVHHSDRGVLGGFTRSSQQLGRRTVAMASRRRSDRALRARCPSPGCPGVARREERRRFWALIAAGQSSWDAAIGVECRRRSGPAGFGRQGECHHRCSGGRPSRSRRGTCRFRSARRSRCGVRLRRFHANRGRPSPTPSPLSGGNSGASRVCSCRHPRQR